MDQRSLQEGGIRLAVTAGLLLSMGCASPERQPSGRLRMSAPRFERELARDPQLDSRMPLPERIALHPMAEQPSRAFHVLIFVGLCDTCQEAALLSWDYWRRDYPQVNLVVIAPDRREAQQGWRRSERVHLPIAFDQGGRLRFAYHAFFSPRAYLLDAHGRLLWLQRDRRQFAGVPIGRIIGGEGARWGSVASRQDADQRGDTRRFRGVDNRRPRRHNEQVAEGHPSPHSGDADERASPTSGGPGSERIGSRR